MSGFKQYLLVSVFSLFSTCLCLGQTYAWSSYPSSATSYTNGNISIAITGTNYDNAGAGSNSPKYSTSCTNPGVLQISENWTNATSSTTIVISFTVGPAAIAPVTFSIQDINANSCNTSSPFQCYWVDEVAISAIDANGNAVTPTTSGTCTDANALSYGVSTAGNTLTIRSDWDQSSGIGGCGCHNQAITVGAANTCIRSITIVYRNNQSANAIYLNDPQSQWIGISSVVTQGQCGITLPIELSSFTTKCVGAKKTFNWQTITETNNAFFILEKSTDGKTFEPLAKIEGMGNNTSEQNYSYSYEDESAAYKYYRLKQTDFNGNSKILKLTYLDCVNALGNLKLAPNPASTEIKFEFEASKEAVFTINITDLMGHLLKSTEHVASEGFNQAFVDIKDLPLGCYQVSVNNNMGSRPQLLKFIKNTN